MQEYSFSSGQLKSFRRRRLLRLCLLSFMMFGVALAVVILYFVGAIFFHQDEKALTGLQWLYGNFLVTILVGLGLMVAFFLPSILILRRSYIRENRAFHQKYLDSMFAECRYNEVNFAFRRKTPDVSFFREMEPLLSIKDIKLRYALSDANPERYMEFDQILYQKDDKHVKSGVLVIYRNNQFLDGFFQIRSRGEPLKKDYQEKEIHRFGFTRHTALQSYEIYSSLGSLTYDCEKRRLPKKIEELHHFLKCDFVATRMGTTITLFFEGFEFNLTHGLFTRYHPSDFDAKVEALLRLHRLTDEVMDELLVSLKA